MDSPFNTIGLIGKPNHPNAAATLQRLHTFLLALGFEVIVEKRTGSQLSDVPSDKLVKLVDLGVSINSKSTKPNHPRGCGSTRMTWTTSWLNEKVFPHLLVG